MGVSLDRIIGAWRRGIPLQRLAFEGATIDSAAGRYATLGDLLHPTGCGAPGFTGCAGLV